MFLSAHVILCLVEGKRKRSNTPGMLAVKLASVQGEQTQDLSSTLSPALFLAVPSDRSNRRTVRFRELARVAVFSPQAPRAHFGARFEEGE